MINYFILEVFFLHLKCNFYFAKDMFQLLGLFKTWTKTNQHCEK